jgi:hypothetical protein
MAKGDFVVTWSRAAEDAYADDLLSAYSDGAAAAFGLMGMAEAIGENDRVRACPHCGCASFARAYCEHPMCDPAECHYWICNDCHKKGRSHSVAPCMSDAGRPEEKR